MKVNWIAAAPFGIEGVAARELRDLGFEASAKPGGAVFSGDLADGFRANLHLRSADRVSLLLGEFPARSFEELFQGIFALPWADFLPRDAAFPVTGKCVRAQLMSLPDCQAITKKAIVKKLQKTYKQNIFPESGYIYRVQIALQGDTCTVSMNASGDALNKRGYRQRHTEAPLRETLAAALLLLAPTRYQALYDPLCGSGTFAVEAAMMRYQRAPGLTRAFDCEKWNFMPEEAMRSLREEAQAQFEEGLALDKAPIYASDIDPEAVEVALTSAKAAGLADKIQVRQGDVFDLRLAEEAGVLVCNPPYGERIGDKQDTARIASFLGKLQRAYPTYTVCALTADPAFAKRFGKRAAKSRRVYNGRIECDFLQFFGKR